MIKITESMSEVIWQPSAHQGVHPATSKGGILATEDHLLVAMRILVVGIGGVRIAAATFS